MQHSDELKDAAGLLIQQVLDLGVPAFGCGFNIWDDDRKFATAWMAGQERFQPPFKTSSSEDVFLRIYEAAQKGEALFVEEQRGEVFKKHYEYMNSIPVFKEIADMMAKEGQSFPTSQIIHCAFFSQGYLMFISYEPVPNAYDIFKRFAKVFEQTYTRFLDLQKAEAQAREAKIEAALERVRSLTMAMQKSEDLNEAASDMFKQIQSLGMQPWGCGFNIFDKDEKAVTQYMSLADGGISPAFRTPLTQDPFFINIYDARKRGDELLVMESSGESLAETYRYMFALPGSGEIFGDLENSGFEMPKFQITHCAYFSQGYLVFITYEPVPEAHDIFKRFAKLFDQTYTRFLDLQKAETQAREAKIETALEKVRSRSMAMHQSNDLLDVVRVLSDQLLTLGLKFDTASFAKIHEDGSWDLWISTPDQPYPAQIYVPYFDHPIFREVKEADDRRESFFERNYTLEEKNSFFKYFFENTAAKNIPDARKQYVLNCTGFARSVFLLKNIWLSVANYKGIPFSKEENAMLQRFANVFEQSYTRFLDLQKAEAQAREAIKQASVDRVRAEIASMRSTEDLERITPLIWNELNILGVPFTRCGVFIVNEEKELIHTYLSTPGGQPIAAFTLPFDTEGIGKTVLYNWRNKQSVTIHWNEEEFKRQSMNLVSQGAIESEEKYLTDHPPTSLDLHFFPFLQGMLYAGNTEPLSDDEKSLVQSLADAFATAYARYEDFNKLEEAKGKIETTLTELKATQEQLIQAEKMASLGELTAGIAHEIQNPLNFVNNFSEVNTELMEELKAERLKPNAERNDSLEDELINDVIDNSEKINHHGKRAGDIVKGMLQHSRSSTGVKELTDINALADEYLRLSYHGLRAKDKSFNATMKTDLDESIGKINIIPQDIGRVVLNLITNAFYVVNEKKTLRQAQGDTYEPTVTISTKKTNGKVELSVKDNGNGIPRKVLDKIFQPFFTTKPTGQGTGLGLSLSYDIVKAHGGEIKVETKEGEGSEFMIQLPVV